MSSAVADSFSCPVCLNIFTVPVLLPCKHVFCLLCLGEYTASANEASLSCPLCRAPLPPKWEWAGDLGIQRAIESAGLEPHQLSPRSVERRAREIDRKELAARYSRGDFPQFLGGAGQIHGPSPSALPERPRVLGTCKRCAKEVTSGPPTPCFFHSGAFKYGKGFRVAWTCCNKEKKDSKGCATGEHEL